MPSAQRGVLTRIAGHNAVRQSASTRGVLIFKSFDDRATEVVFELLARKACAPMKWHIRLVISYNSCRTRHRPRCQGERTLPVARRLRGRAVARLSLSHRIHVAARAFCPHLQNKRLLYDLLLRASVATLLELARDPTHLRADLGFLGVLHTRGPDPSASPHVHHIVPAGGLTPDGSQMDHFFQPIPSARPCTQPCLPRQVRSRTLTTLLAAQGPVSAHSRGLVSPADPTRSSDSSSAKTGWPASSHPSEVLNPVLNYLVRYTHRVAISNHRLVVFQNDRGLVSREKLRPRAVSRRS
jgi:putative transposase